MRVEFTVGFGDQPADVPAEVKAAIMMQADWWNANRTGGDDNPASMGVSAGVMRMIRHLNIRGYS